MHCSCARWKKTQATINNDLCKETQLQKENPSNVEFDKRIIKTRQLMALDSFSSTLIGMLILSEKRVSIYRL